MEKFTRQERISDTGLVDAIREAERGTIAADLGGGVIKQRVARQGQGKSGGYRMIVAYKNEDRAVFMYGFAKSQRDNIGPKELEAFKTAATAWFLATDAQIEGLKSVQALFEIEVDDEQGR